MSNYKETQGSIITLDGLPIGQSHNPMAFLHKHQGQSADYALEHGGYGIEERENVIAGYMSYLTIKERRGYGVNGFVVRTAEELQAISLTEGGRFAGDYYFTDNVAKPMLQAFRHALNYTDSALSAINGELDGWALLVAARFGIAEEEL